MEILKKRLDGKTLVILAGSLDSQSAQQVSHALCEIVRQGDPDLVIDLSQVDFVSSVGLSVLLTVWKASREQGGDLVLIGVNAGIENLLEITSFTSFIKVYPSLNAALANPIKLPENQTGSGATSH